MQGLNLLLMHFFLLQRGVLMDFTQLLQPDSCKQSKSCSFCTGFILVYAQYLALNEEFNFLLLLLHAGVFPIMLPFCPFGLHTPLGDSLCKQSIVMLSFLLCWLQLSLPQSEAMRGREESQAVPSCFFWDAGMRLWLAKHKVSPQTLPLPARCPAVVPAERKRGTSLVSPGCVWSLSECVSPPGAGWWMTANFCRLYLLCQICWRVRLRVRGGDDQFNLCTLAHFALWSAVNLTQPLPPHPAHFQGSAGIDQAIKGFVQQGFCGRCVKCPHRQLCVWKTSVWVYFVW